MKSAARNPLRKITLSLLVGGALLSSGCGYHYHLKGHGTEKPYPAVTLKMAEKRKALSEIFLMKFGYNLVLVSEDPSIVRIVPGGKPPWGKPLFLLGTSLGTTKVHYGNGMAMNWSPEGTIDNPKPISIPYLRNWSAGMFTVTVISDDRRRR